MQGGDDVDNTNGISQVAYTALQGHFLRGADAPLSGASLGGGVNHGNLREKRLSNAITNE